MHSTFAIGGALKPNSPIRRQAEDLGLACQLALRLSHHAGTALIGFADLARAAQQVGQFKVYLNGYDACVGYVIWAMLSPDVERVFIDSGPRQLEDWEFNEGTSPWILDFAVDRGSLPYVLADLRDSVFKDYNHVSYFRAKRGQLICKCLSRDDCSSFMAQSALSVRLT